jgi:putative nucleotidyltransferase with HDIG domain
MPNTTRPLQAEADKRMAHLFRDARRAGRLHPLQHLLQRHRAEHPAAAAPTSPAGGLSTTANTTANTTTEAPTEPALPRLHPALVQERVRELPAWPQAALDALQALHDEHTSSQRCAELINRDQGLVARTLRLANSAFYGVPGRVAHTRDAVHLLGRRNLGSAITMATLTQQFPQAQGAGLPLARFWRHALATALVARDLARHLQAPAETAFTAGLLHDIGRLALAVHFPAQVAALGRARLQPAQDLTAGDVLERQVTGLDHAAVGALVAARWNFPADVAQAIAQHHAPGPAERASLCDTVHVADAMAHALDLADDGDECVPDLDPAAWQRLALPTPVVLAIFKDTEAGVAELCQALGLH